jgi:hypothetical protein
MIIGSDVRTPWPISDRPTVRVTLLSGLTAIQTLGWNGFWVSIPVASSRFFAGK